MKNTAFTPLKKYVTPQCLLVEPASRVPGGWLWCKLVWGKLSCWIRPRTDPFQNPVSNRGQWPLPQGKVKVLLSFLLPLEIFNDCERKVFSLPMVEGGIDFTARGYNSLVRGSWEGGVKGFFHLWSFCVTHKNISSYFEVFTAVKSGVNETYQLIVDSANNFPITF